MGTQKNCLNETVLLKTENLCKLGRVRKYLQFHAQKFYLSKPDLVYKVCCSFSDQYPSFKDPGEIPLFATGKLAQIQRGDRGSGCPPHTHTNIP